MISSRGHLPLILTLKHQCWLEVCNPPSTQTLIEIKANLNERGIGKIQTFYSGCLHSALGNYSKDMDLKQCRCPCIRWLMLIWFQMLCIFLTPVSSSSQLTQVKLLFILVQGWQKSFLFFREFCFSKLELLLQPLPGDQALCQVLHIPSRFILLCSHT